MLVYVRTEHFIAPLLIPTSLDKFVILSQVMQLSILIG